eukprot:2685186-Pleurochrysis_carterae.AAC.1
MCAFRHWYPVFPLFPRRAHRVIRTQGIVTRLVVAQTHTDRDGDRCVAGARVLGGHHMDQHPPAPLARRCGRPPLDRRPREVTRAIKGPLLRVAYLPRPQE